MTDTEQLVPTEKYLTTGSHIGTIFKTGDMMRYVFKKRKDGLYVLDVENIDKRLRVASEFLGKYPYDRITVVARRLYSQAPAKKFAELVGAKVLTGRFIPGTFTNPKQKNFMEPRIVIVTDPETDSQAVLEASKQSIPVVALASTNNYLKFIDLVIPINNKGRKSLALAFWVLARELLKLRGDIKGESDFSTTQQEFEYIPKGGSENEEEDPIKQAIQESQRMRYKGRKGRRDAGSGFRKPTRPGGRPPMGGGTGGGFRRPRF